MNCKNKKNSKRVYHNYDKEEVEAVIEVAKDFLTKEYLDEGLDYLKEDNQISAKIMSELGSLYEVEIKLSINKKPSGREEKSNSHENIKVKEDN